VLLSSQPESFFKLADAAQQVHRQLKQPGVLQVPSHGLMLLNPGLLHALMLLSILVCCMHLCDSILACCMGDSFLLSSAHLTHKAAQI